MIATTLVRGAKAASRPFRVRRRGRQYLSGEIAALDAMHRNLTEIVEAFRGDRPDSHFQAGYYFRVRHVKRSLFRMRQTVAAELARSCGIR